MKLGVIGVPGVWSSEKLADRVEEKTGYRLLLSAEDLSLNLNGRNPCFEHEELMVLDGLIVKKIGATYSHHLLDRIEILKFLEHKGLKIFSKPDSIALAADRLSCTLRLIRGGITMPETVITESVERAERMVGRFGKAVFKPLFSSKARGMVVIESGPDALSRIEEFKAANPIMYLQKMVEMDHRDLGLAFLGGEYMATYARVGRKDTWNTTTHFGGRYQKYEPSGEVLDLATRAQALFDLDFTCVDVAETPDGPIVFEVSAFGGYKGLMETHGIDAAEAYADHVMKKIRNGN